MNTSGKFISKIPIRLSEGERDTFRCLVASLAVSEYTDDVDSFRLRTSSRDKTCTDGIHELFKTLIGVLLSGDGLPKEMHAVLKRGNVSVPDIEPVLQDVFEIGRRYKILNCRDFKDYGKLVMVLQDIRRLKMFEAPLRPIKTIGSVLGRDATSVFLNSTCFQLIKDGKGIDQKTIDAVISECIAANDTLKRDDVERSVRSAEDYLTHTRSNTQAINTLLEWLHVDGLPSVAIRPGDGGSKLSHNNATQRAYVKESLTLWTIIQRDLLKYWFAIEADMVSSDFGCQYRFENTGQGYHRVVSSAPETARCMSEAISEAHATLGGWVGIKVVHLGDRDVPNPLVFIDKYTIIPRLLSPVVHTITSLTKLDERQEEEHPGIKNMLRKKYGSIAELKNMILQDFFKHAFDGSGDDGGNCIDGRLTSAWNWCSLLHKKPFYDSFVLTGFNGFD